MTLPYGLFGSREGITSVFDGALGPSSHTERLLTIKGEDGNEVMLRLPLPPHHFFLYRCPVENAANMRGYQLVISVPRVSPEDKAWLRQMIGDLHAGREQEQEESASGVEAVTAVAAATTMGHEEEAEALINQAANLVAELQPNDYLFTTDVKTIATLFYVAAFLSKLVPVTAAFKGKEALQQALWRVVHAPWNSPPSTHVRHVVPPSASQDGRPYLMPMQYIGDRRNAVLEIMVPLSQLPVGSQKMVRDSFLGLVRDALGQAVAERAMVLEGDVGLEGVAIRIDDRHTKVPLSPISSWSSLPRSEWRFQLRCDIYFVGLDQMSKQHALFPNKHKNADGALPLSAKLQEIIDSSLVSSS
jgi:hypothetical protein